VQKKKKFKETVSIRYFNVNDEVSMIDNIQIIKFEVSDNVDLCILEKAKHGLKYVSLVKNYEKSVNFGDKVYIVGAPSGIFPTITEGYVSYLYMPELNNKLFISSPVWSGNSGGPVFNARGKVIGLVVMVNVAYHHSTLAITVPDIWKFLNAK
jgi:serine protease Do